MGYACGLTWGDIEFPSADRPCLENDQHASREVDGNWSREMAARGAVNITHKYLDHDHSPQSFHKRWVAMWTMAELHIL